MRIYIYFGNIQFAISITSQSSECLLCLEQKQNSENRDLKIKIKIHIKVTVNEINVHIIVNIV